MDKQYDSGYLHINNIEDYSDQALQEIAQQICSVVQRECYVHIDFKHAFNSLLADVRTCAWHSTTTKC